MVEMFNEQYKRQESSKGHSKEYKEELEEKVRDLEQRTWAAKGATEDLGSTSLIRRLDSETKDSKIGSMRSPIKKLTLMSSETKPENSAQKNTITNLVAPSRNAIPTKDEEDAWADDYISEHGG